MIPTLDTTPVAPARNQLFTATHWTVVLAARDPDCPAAQEALEQLCQTYWYPLYAYARRKGCPEEDAKDATQALFAGILEAQSLAKVRPDKGKFRSFLVACMNHILSDRRDRVDAQKRGGGRTILSLDDSTVEDRYRREPADLMDPEKLCERRWALTVLEQAQLRLKGEFVKKGKSREYEMLKDCLSGDEKLPRYAEIAADLQCAEGTIHWKICVTKGGSLRPKRLRVLVTDCRLVTKKASATRPADTGGTPPIASALSAERGPNMEWAGPTLTLMGLALGLLRGTMSSQALNQLCRRD